eukprot:Hpha_TRINITY_DN14666_c3_g1::TRINITY_DN14666_c3_g1_i1::g.48467::m.48467
MAGKSIQALPPSNRGSVLVSFFRRSCKFLFWGHKVVVVGSKMPPPRDRYKINGMQVTVRRVPPRPQRKLGETKKFNGSYAPRPAGVSYATAVGGTSADSMEQDTDHTASTPHPAGTGTLAPPTPGTLEDLTKQIADLTATVANLASQIAKLREENNAKDQEISRLQTACTHATVGTPGRDGGTEPPGTPSRPGKRGAELLTGTPVNASPVEREVCE